MNMHRSGKEGQWEAVAPEDRNAYQKIAAKTHGIVTPANTVSLVGAGLVASGLKDVATGKTAKGIVKISVGRGADLGDGRVAEKTQTKGPIGEALDVVIDKTEMAAVLPVFVHKNILPQPAAGVIAAQNAANTAFSAIAKRRGITLHPSREGKMATFGQWTTGALYGSAFLARENEMSGLARGLEVAGHISLAATAALGAKAILGYAQETLLPVPNPPVDTAEQLLAPPAL